MSPEKMIALGAVVVVIIFIGFGVFKKLPKRLRQDKFARKWKALQQRCPDEGQWSTAIREADDLLDEALRKKRIKGKTMGERLVAAQNRFTENDAVWYGHKLRKKLDAEPEHKLRKQDVQRALFGLRQGLKDVGAL